MTVGTLTLPPVPSILLPTGSNLLHFLHQRWHSTTSSCLLSFLRHGSVGNSNRVVLQFLNTSSSLTLPSIRSKSSKERILMRRKQQPIQQPGRNSSSDYCLALIHRPNLPLRNCKILSIPSLHSSLIAYLPTTRCQNLPRLLLPD